MERDKALEVLKAAGYNTVYNDRANFPDVDDQWYPEHDEILAAIRALESPERPPDGVPEFVYGWTLKAKNGQTWYFTQAHDPGDYRYRFDGIVGKESSDE